MKLIHLFSILLLMMVLNAQDDFFEPGYSIGGYGELHWNRELDKNGETTENQMDFHRFIIYCGYNWTEEWSFKSELELEHNYVKDSHGELELEQAYVHYQGNDWGFGVGVVLASMGIINETHEPTLQINY